MRTDAFDLRKITKFRIVMLVFVCLLVLPTIVSGVSHTDLAASTADNQTAAATSGEVTFVTAQGKEFTSDDARLVAYNENETPIRVYSRYTRYYDVDPLGGDRILFVASADGVPESNYTGRFVAVEMNWRTGTIYREFPVPTDTHDVDYLGNDTYAVAAKASNSVYVYNYTLDKRVWQYNFTDHFPPYPKAGGKETGYTHLNDIDSVNNGSAFLVSPRNFDRVMLINRSTKKVEWTLGEENNYTILNEQHNPEILSQHPLTVLVADSENDRVVEYRRTQTGWHLDWAYNDLSWPRDADRLPNGNTMIADSSGTRALVVTPQGEVVWKVDISFGPYDIERLSLGDEPSGPTAREMGIAGQYGVAEVHNESDSTSVGTATVDRLDHSFNFVYTTTQWVLPTWITRFDFGLLALVPFIGVVWGGVEISRVWPSHTTERFDHLARNRRVVSLILAIGSVLVGVVLLAISIAPGRFTTLVVSIGFLSVIEGVRTVVRDDWLRDGSRSQAAIRLFYSLLRVGAVLAAGVLVFVAATTHGALIGVYIASAVLLVLSATRPGVDIVR